MWHGGRFDRSAAPFVKSNIKTAAEGRTILEDIVQEKEGDAVVVVVQADKEAIALKIPVANDLRPLMSSIENCGCPQLNWTVNGFRIYGIHPTATSDA
jgi:hypothetical protein